MAITGCGIEKSGVLAGIPQLRSLLLRQKNINLSYQPLQLGSCQTAAQPLSDYGRDQIGFFILAEIDPSAPALTAKTYSYLFKEGYAGVFVSRQTGQIGILGVLQHLVDRTGLPAEELDVPAEGYSSCLRADSRICRFIPSADRGPCPQIAHCPTTASAADRVAF